GVGLPCLQSAAQLVGQAHLLGSQIPSVDPGSTQLLAPAADLAGQAGFGALKRSQLVDRIAVLGLHCPGGAGCTGQSGGQLPHSIAGAAQLSAGILQRGFQIPEYIDLAQRLFYLLHQLTVFFAKAPNAPRGFIHIGREPEFNLRHACLAWADSVHAETATTDTPAPGGAPSWSVDR